MRVGISLTSHHEVADPREAARWMIERQAARRRAAAAWRSPRRLSHRLAECAGSFSR
jgi:hypothetical protein